MVILYYVNFISIKQILVLITALGLYLWVERSGDFADSKLGISLISYFVIKLANVILYCAWSCTSGLGERKFLKFVEHTSRSMPSSHSILFTCKRNCIVFWVSCKDLNKFFGF